MLKQSGCWPRRSPGGGVAPRALAESTGLTTVTRKLSQSSPRCKGDGDVSSYFLFTPACITPRVFGSRGKPPLLLRSCSRIPWRRPPPQSSESYVAARPRGFSRDLEHGGRSQLSERASPEASSKSKVRVCFLRNSALINLHCKLANWLESQTSATRFLRLRAPRNI